MWVLIAELRNADVEERHDPMAFRPYGEGEPTEDDILAVYAWAEAKGYQHDRDEVRVSICQVSSPAERSVSSRFNAVPPGPGDKDALRALA